jgi:hypothetical protein
MRRLLFRIAPDIIFIQDTLVDEKKARIFMNTFCPSWLTCGVSSVGNYGDLLVSLDPNKFVLDSYLCCGGFFLTGTCLENKNSLYVLNVYGPCTDIILFWGKVASRGMLEHKKLIVAGDLNFTVSGGEVWGASTQLDQLAGYFKEFF